MRRRERRPRGRSYKFLYVTGVVAILLAIMIVALYSIYNKKLNDISKSMLSTEQIIGLVPNNEEDIEDSVIEATGSIISKTIEEAQNELENKTEENIVENQENTTELTVEEQTAPIVEKKEEVKKELVFAYPVEGEILREFSMDELIYSETLDEWTVHQGLDIKADRTTVVKAAEAGTVVAIKNDPRYGLTVIIEHEDGYKTIYSNLLTTEFVVEDEKVEKGQSIGTVGNSAVFEIADEPHLHFEMIKDGEYVDPKLYLK
ncbi:MAG: peptidoglycan DD-metalloendopeptidase family protein [Clostridia bacterium]|nr:peptidoglycan DD-metalloendopeptidase family protein [Clostridia bacterium]